MRREGLRVGISTLVALSGAIGAHHFGGGGFISGSALLVEISLLFAALLALRKYKYDGPALAALITIAQLCSHFILGTSARIEDSNSSRMTCAHFFFGVLTYLLISNFESFWKVCTNFICDFLLPRCIVGWRFISQKNGSISPARMHPFSFYFVQSHGLRAPPVHLLNI